MADIKRQFTPEFRNRLDAIVNFKALDANIILRVVDKFLLGLEVSWPRRRSMWSSRMHCVRIWRTRALTH